MDDIALAETPEDIDYVRRNYVDAMALGHDVRAFAGSSMPRATYRLADGTLWFPRDWWRLAGDAGGPDRVRDLFVVRYRAAARMAGLVGDVDGDWSAYLDGLYGACLRDVTPETIVWKERLVAKLDRALAEPRPDERVWCDEVRGDIASLDGLVRPFAACDRTRFGRPTSRDRLITAPRARYPEL